MPKDYNVPDSSYIFRVVSGEWRCINHPEEKRVLYDFLSDHDFFIPDAITYCLASNDRYALKFRASGGFITVYINPLKPYY